VRILCQQTIQGGFGKAEIDLRRRLPTQPGILEGQIADLLLETLVLPIEQDHHFPQLLRIANLIDLDHEEMISQSSHCRKLSIWIDNRRRQGPPAHLPAAFQEQRELGGRELHQALSQPPPQRCEPP
jgi:hypothetical protein